MGPALVGKWPTDSRDWERRLRFAEGGPSRWQKRLRKFGGVGGQANGLECNVRSAESVEAFFQVAENAQGPVTGLVNNAAANFLAASETLSANAFDAVIQTNLYGAFHCTRWCGEKWIERETSGSVVSIVTTYARTGSAFVMPSAASKAGVAAMTKSLATEWGLYNIRLNAIAPWTFPTEGAWQRLVPDEAMAEQMRQCLLCTKSNAL